MHSNGQVAHESSVWDRMYLLIGKLIELFARRICCFAVRFISVAFAYVHRWFAHRYYAEVLREQVVQVAKASGAKVYLATISVIGEEVNNTNHAKIITCACPHCA